VSRDILDALAVDIDFTPVAQRLEELLACERALFAFDDCFGTLRHDTIQHVHL
jgi:hypothetical protein